MNLSTKRYLDIISLLPEGWDIKLKRDHTFMTSTQKGGGGILTFVTCLRILLFLNNRSNCSFLWMVGWGVKKLVIFCGRHKWMNPNREVLSGTARNLTDLVYLKYSKEIGYTFRESIITKAQSCLY